MARCQVDIIDHLSVSQPDGPIDGCGDVLFVSRDQHGHSAVVPQPGQQLEDLRTRLRIEIASRLVGKK